MFFKSATFFQLGQRIDIDALVSALPNFPLTECEASAAFSFGSLPLVRNSEAFALQSNNCLLMRFGKDEKSLPASVVREELEKKVAEIELLEGRKVGRKEKSDMKEELTFTLRPKAFPKRTDVWMHVDNKACLFVIYSTNAGMIEQTFKHLQTMLGSFPIIPLQAQVSPSRLMTEWLLRNEIPGSLETGERCDIQEYGTNTKAKIAFTNLEPLSEDVTRHLEQGMLVKNLALRWSDKFNFTLDESLTISKVKWDDQLKEAAFNDSQGGGLSDMDANFALTSLTTREFFANLSVWFEIATIEQEQAA